MRSRVLALAGLLALPSLAAAQQNPLQLPFSRFAVTPFVGVQVPYSAGEHFVYTESGAAYRVGEERAGGALAGAEVEARVWGPLGVVGSLAYGQTGETVLALRSADGDALFYGVDGPEVWFGKLGLSYRLPDPDPDRRRFHPSGFLVAGPSLVRVDHPDDDATGEAWSRPSTHWGLNLGIHTATRLGSSPRLALHLGLEDYLTFWNAERRAIRDEAIFGAVLEEATLVEYNAVASNLLVLRAGVSFRF